MEKCVPHVLRRRRHRQRRLLRALSDRRVAAALDAAAMTTALTVSATSSNNSAISMDAPRCSCNFLRAAPMSVTCLPCYVVGLYVYFSKCSV